MSALVPIAQADALRWVAPGGDGDYLRALHAAHAAVCAGATADSVGAFLRAAAVASAGT